MKPLDKMVAGDRFWAAIDDNVLRMEFVGIDGEGRYFARSIFAVHAVPFRLYRVYQYQAQPTFEDARRDAIGNAMSTRDDRQASLDESTARIAALIAAQAPSEEEDEPDETHDLGEPVADTPLVEVPLMHTVPEF